MKQAVRAEWRQVVLICRKCSKKLGGGFGPDGDQSLAQALKRSSGGGKKRKAPRGVVEVGCLDVCPKRGVVVIDADRPREWLIVQEGTPVADVEARLAPGKP
jgi:predicted metal-binding protein